MKRSVCAVISMLAVGLFFVLDVSSAQAGPTFGDPINIKGSAHFPIPGLPSATTWGGAAEDGFPELPHPFGAQDEDATIYIDQFYGSPWTVAVTSGELPVALPRKFKGYIELDFTSFHADDFAWHFVEIGPFKEEPGNNYIWRVQVAEGSVGTAITDGSLLFWSATGADLAANPIVRIEWGQIPSPGAMALLGVAGVMTRRRRR